MGGGPPQRFAQPMSGPHGGAVPPPGMGLHPHTGAMGLLLGEAPHETLLLRDDTSTADQLRAWEAALKAHVRELAADGGAASSGSDGAAPGAALPVNLS